MPSDLITFWKDNSSATPPSLRRRNTSVVLHLVHCEFPLQLCLLGMALYQYLGPLLTFTLQTMKNHWQTSLLCWLFGFCFLFFFFLISVRMRWSWRQDWVGSFNSNIAKWFKGLLPSYFEVGFIWLKDSYIDYIPGILRQHQDCMQNYLFWNINLSIFFDTSVDFVFLLPTRLSGHVFIIFLCKYPLEYRILSKACSKPCAFFFLNERLNPSLPVILTHLFF